MHVIKISHVYIVTRGINMLWKYHSIKYAEMTAKNSTEISNSLLKSILHHRFHSHSSIYQRQLMLLCFTLIKGAQLREDSGT